MTSGGFCERVMGKVEQGMDWPVAIVVVSGTWAEVVLLLNLWK